MCSGDEKPAATNGKDTPSTPGAKKGAIAHSNFTKGYIVSALTHGEISQGELGKKMGIAQSTISGLFSSTKARAEMLGVELWDERAYDATVKVDKSAITPTPKRKRATPKSKAAASGDADGADADGANTPTAKTPRKRKTPAKPRAKKEEAAAAAGEDADSEDKSSAEVAAVKMDDEHEEE